MKDSKSSHEEAMAEVRRVVAEAKELSGAADGALTDHLAAWLAGRYAIATRQLALENGDGALDWNLLRALCHDLVDLRRGDHSAESLRIERERLEMDRAKQKEEMERRFWEWAKENRGKICQESLSSPEEKEKVMRQILGLSEPDDPPPTQGNGNERPVCDAPNPPANKAE
ncbi:MAG: hypothetical protein ABSF38_06665 [Verrucomicrobiota bacterium]|jgi:hypothetical protein